MPEEQLETKQKKIRPTSLFVTLFPRRKALRAREKIRLHLRLMKWKRGTDETLLTGVALRTCGGRGARRTKGTLETRLTSGGRFTEGALRANGGLDGLLTVGALGALGTNLARGAEDALGTRGTGLTLGTDLTLGTER